MKTLALALLWILAFFIALWLLVRARRGRPVVLKGRMAPRLARMVVVLLVALGVGTQSSDAGEPQDDAPKKDKQANAQVPDVLNAG